MERPQKRHRPGRSPFDDGDEDEDELCQDPVVLAAKQDPGYQLQKSRAKAAFRLKSTFEDIFEKYGKDFTGIGDEIDLRTGEVVVDNGHLQAMASHEVGGAFSSHAASVADSSEDEARILHGTTTKIVEGGLIGPIRQDARSSLWSHSTSPSEGQGRLSQLYFPSPRLELAGAYPIFDFPRLSSDFTDPAWRVPDLPHTPFQQEYRFGRPGDSFGQTGARPTTTRKLLPAIQLVDEDEDDILLGSAVSGYCGTIPKDTSTTNRIPETNTGQALVKAAGISGGKLEQYGYKASIAFRKSASALVPAKKAGQLAVVTKQRTRRTIGETVPLDGDSEGTEAYEDISWKFKPVNQVLVVAIRAKDTKSSPNARQPVTDISVPRGTAVVRRRGRPRKLAPASPPLTGREDTPLRTDIIPDSQNPSPTLTASPCKRLLPARQTFSRNILDAAYAFSDEEESMPPRRHGPSGTGLGISALGTLQPGEERQGSVDLGDPSGTHAAEGVELSISKGAGKEPAKGHRRRGRPRKTSEGEKDSSTNKGVPESKRNPSNWASKPVAALIVPAAETLGTPKRPHSDTSELAPPNGPEGQLYPNMLASGQQTPPATPDDRKVAAAAAAAAVAPASSSVKATIMSLVSDDEEDELSFQLSISTPQKPYDASLMKTKRKSWSAVARIKVKERLGNTTTPQAAKLPMAQRGTRSTGGKTAGTRAAADHHSTPRAVRRSVGVDFHATGTSSPSASLVKTPGGTLRRCGEGGFKCDRDFCFTCL